MAHARNQAARTQQLNPNRLRCPADTGKRFGLPVEPHVPIEQRWAQVAARQETARAARAWWETNYVLPDEATWHAWRDALPPLGELTPWAQVSRGEARALLVEMQGGVCAVCLLSVRQEGREHRNLRDCLDHDHASGLVRGVVCNVCNLGEGTHGRRDHAVFAAYRTRPPASGSDWYDRGFIRREPAGTEPPRPRPDWRTQQMALERSDRADKQYYRELLEAYGVSVEASLFLREWLGSYGTR